jgi:hypothetical protein
MTTSKTRGLAVGTRVHVRSAHFVEQCDGIITATHYDDGWLYRIQVTAGDRLDQERNDDGELWVCDFEAEPISDAEA